MQGQGQPYLPNWASCSLVCYYIRSLHSAEEEAALCAICQCFSVPSALSVQQAQ